MRLGWHPCENLEFSLVGQNLPSKRHDEWGMGNNVFASDGATQLLWKGHGPMAVGMKRFA